MSAADRLDDVARLADAAGREIAAGGTVPDGVAALFHARTFVAAADEDGLIDAVETLAAGDEGDAAVADVVESLRTLGLADEAEQVSTAYNWSEDGYPVDPESGVKAAAVRSALDARFEESLDAEGLEERLAALLDEDPSAFGL